MAGDFDSEFIPTPSSRRQDFSNQGFPCYPGDGGLFADSASKASCFCPRVWPIRHRECRFRTQVRPGLPGDRTRAGRARSGNDRQTGMSPSRCGEKWANAPATHRRAALPDTFSQRMLARYSHVCMEAKRQALNALSRGGTARLRHKERHKSRFRNHRRRGSD